MPAGLGIDAWCDLHGGPKPPPDPALDRLGQMLDRTLPDRQPAEPAASRETELERAVLHAVQSASWDELIDDGATNLQIFEALKQFLKVGRRIVRPEASGGSFGYTIYVGAESAYFWLGTDIRPGVKADLSGTTLFQMIRNLLEIPTPAQAAKNTFREAAIRQGIPMNRPVSQQRPSAPRFVLKPADGWEDAELHNAADDLGIAFNDLAICDKCQAARDHVVHPCPKCKSPRYRRTDSDAVWGAPEQQPVKRGRGRPPGSKTRKAVEA